MLPRVNKQEGRREVRTALQVMQIHVRAPCRRGSSGGQTIEFQTAMGLLSVNLRESETESVVERD